MKRFLHFQHPHPMNKNQTSRRTAAFTLAAGLLAAMTSFGQDRIEEGRRAYERGDYDAASRTLQHALGEIENQVRMEVQR